MALKKRQLLEIQSHLISRSNTLRMQGAIHPQDLLSMSGVQIVERMQNSILLSSIYDNLLDSLDRMLDGTLEINDYSVVVLLVYAIGQLITIRAYRSETLTFFDHAPSTQAAQDEVMAVINYLTTYTGREILPRFE